MSQLKRSVSRKTRAVRRTLLAVGEGYTEAAFLKHLRSLYCSDGAGVEAKIDHAYGGSPADAICHIPDDWIDNRRYPLFVARDVMRAMINRLQP